MPATALAVLLLLVALGFAVLSYVLRSRKLAITAGVFGILCVGFTAFLLLVVAGM